MEKASKTISGRYDFRNDQFRIKKLSEDHINDPDGFINSLDNFFSNIFREMLQTRQLQKGANHE